MKIKISKSYTGRVLRVLADKVHGEKFTVGVAQKIFDAQDDGWLVLLESKAIANKFKNFEVACWRQL